MKIVIVVAGSSGHLSGVSRHAANLARCLLTRAGVTAVHVIAAECQWQSLDAALPRNDARLHLHEVAIANDPIGRNLPGEDLGRAGDRLKRRSKGIGRGAGEDVHGGPGLR